MNKIVSPPDVTPSLKPSSADANPRAASTRLKARSRSQAYGQRRHDYRKGPQPDYVDGARSHWNRDLLVPRPIAEIRREVLALRDKGGARRRMKSNAAIVTAGIITFGHEAAELFAALSTADQDEAFMTLATAVADRLGTTLEGLVVHLDESTIHAHYELRGYDDAGTPISKVATFKVMSELQDLTADIMGRYCPGIERGHRKWSRIEAGADYADTLNRSVKQLHQDLPREIEAKEAELEILRTQADDLAASAAKTQGHLAKLEAMATLNAKEEKRLAVYNTRLAKKEAEQADVIAKLEETMARIAAHRAAIETRAGALDAQERDAEARMEKITVSLEAVDAVVSGLEDGSMTLQDDGRLRMADPKPLQSAPAGLAKRLLKLAQRFLVHGQRIEAKLSRLDRLAGALKNWLRRDDLTVDARRDGERLERDASSGPDV